jgi:phage terminase small subunit
MAAEIAAKPLQDAANPLQNTKHEAVLQHYFSDPQHIGSHAWQRVYPDSSLKAAEVSFARLLKTPKFASRLAWLQKSAADDNVMSLNEVLVELSKLGRSNIKKAVLHGDDTDELVDSIESLPDDAAATIQELTIETYLEGGGEDARQVKRVKMKLHGKHAPLAELRRHYEPDRHADPDGRALGTAAAEVGKVSELEIARRLAFLLTRGERANTSKKAKP